MNEFLGFGLCALVIFLAGKKLSHYGDQLAEKTGLGKAFIGLVLMSAVTSLPELMVGISSSAIVQSADLAVGDILGSCAANLAILAIMDVYCKPDHPLLSSVSQSQILAAALGIILLTLACLGLFLREEFIVLPYIGVSSLLFAVIYFFALNLIYKNQKKNPEASTQSHEVSDLSLKGVLLRYLLFAVIIIGAALFLPHFAEQIADKTGLGKSFVGTLMLAVSTSLPEIAVSIASVRMGAVDMAVGNLLGSNIFNMFILFLDDIFYPLGPILKSASDTLMIPALCTIMMSAITIIGISYKNKVKGFLMDWDTLMILLVYLIGLGLLYKLS